MDKLGSFLSGTIAPVLSLVGVIFLLVALKHQRKDFATNAENLSIQTDAFKQQVEEFNLQRQELEETRKVFEEQAETQKLQRFENTFFQLLNFHNHIISALQYRHGHAGQRTAVGRDVFEILHKEFVKISQGADPAAQHEISQPMDNLLIVYSILYNRHQSILGHYFRHLYHTIKHIQGSSLEKREKQKYTSLTRAQLSSNELFLLYYNGLSVWGREKFKPLIESFALLENIDRMQLLDGTTPGISYTPAAFGDTQPIGEKFNKSQEAFDEFFSIRRQPILRENSNVLY